MHDSATSLALDPGFSPAVLSDKEYWSAAQQDPHRSPVAIAVTGPDGSVFRRDIAIVGESHPKANESLSTLERIAKRLLWERGGFRLSLGGDAPFMDRLAAMFTPNGSHSFDVDIMKRIYGRLMEVEILRLDRIPEAKDSPRSLGGHWDGCRIGFDLGASDWKIAAVLQGDVIFTEETPWDPSTQSDPMVHYRILSEGIARAAKTLPRVDAIGGSAAGIYVDNRVRVASLFRSVGVEDWPKAESIFLRIQQEWGVPMAVANDGDVAALGGALALERPSLLALALGSSEACGYIDSHGNLTGWLNELAFIPIDLQIGAPIDDWSLDRGCGAQYLSQQGVLRLAERAGFRFDPQASQAERLLAVQETLKNEDPRTTEIFRTIGTYLGYSLAQVADSYDVETAIIMGRVTSGDGGRIIVETAIRLLGEVFPSLNERIDLRLPDEASRRIGQAVAAASLPVLQETS